MADVEPGWIRVEVAYALPHEQVILGMPVPRGTTAVEAVRRSGILEKFAELDVEQLDLGIFGEVIGCDRPLEPGDRVEIYRPLEVDPREARRRRVAEGKWGHS